MATVEYHNTNMYYIKNEPNYIYGGTVIDAPDKTYKFTSIQTGWHFIPNVLMQNFLVEKQYFDLYTNHSAWALDSIEVIVQNLIPLTDNLAINQETTFMTFNNTIYALGYQDNHYECNFNEESTDLVWREGMVFQQSGTQAPTVKGKLYLPQYVHYLPHWDSSTPSTAFGWDPFVHSNSLSELRPGKNAITFNWKADETKWYTCLRDFTTANTEDKQNAPYYDYFNFTQHAQWLTPASLIKTDPRTSYWVKQRAFFTPEHLWANPIPMMLIKMIPIYGQNNALLQHEAQIVIHKIIRFKVKPRKSGTNYPQLSAKYATKSNYGWTLANRPAMENWQPCIGPPEKTRRMAHGRLDWIKGPFMPASTAFADDRGKVIRAKPVTTGPTSTEQAPPANE